MRTILYIHYNLQQRKPTIYECSAEVIGACVCVYCDIVKGEQVNEKKRIFVSQVK